MGTNVYIRVKKSAIGVVAYLEKQIFRCRGMLECLRFSSFFFLNYHRQ